MSDLHKTKIMKQEQQNILQSVQNHINTYQESYEHHTSQI